MIARATRRLGAIALGCVFPLLGGCGDVREAGGTGSETTALGARVLRLDGSPASGAMVRLIDLEQWGRRIVSDSGPVVDSVATDSSGWFRFEGVPPGEYALEVRQREAAFHRSDIAVSFGGGERRLDDLQLQRVGTISGIVHSDGASPRRVLLSGTGLSAAVDSTGAFSFATVPPGEYDVLVSLVGADDNSWQRAGGVRIAEGAALSGLDLRVRSRRILLDDFDDGDRYSLLRRLQRGGWWFYHDDSAYGGSSRLEPIAAEGDLGQATTDSSAWKGRSLHARFRLGSSGTTQFALVGVEVAPRKSLQTSRGWVDLRELDSLVFMAKGDGRVRIQFTTRAMQERTGGTVQFEASFTPTGTWTRFVVSREAIVLPANPKVSGLVWNEVAAEVGSIQFLVNKDTDLWLDEPTLVGIGLEALLGGTR